MAETSVSAAETSCLCQFRKDLDLMATRAGIMERPSLVKKAGYLLLPRLVARTFLGKNSVPRKCPRLLTARNWAVLSRIAGFPGHRNTYVAGLFPEMFFKPCEVATSSGPNVISSTSLWTKWFRFCFFEADNSQWGPCVFHPVSDLMRSWHVHSAQCRRVHGPAMWRNCYAKSSLSLRVFRSASIRVATEVKKKGKGTDWSQHWTHFTSHRQRTLCIVNHFYVLWSLRLSNLARCFCKPQWLPALTGLLAVGPSISTATLPKRIGGAHLTVQPIWFFRRWCRQCFTTLVSDLEVLWILGNQHWFVPHFEKAFSTKIDQCLSTIWTSTWSRPLSSLLSCWWRQDEGPGFLRTKRRAARARCKAV